MNLFDDQAFAQIPGQMSMETDTGPGSTVSFEIGQRTITGTVLREVAAGHKWEISTDDGVYSMPKDFVR